MNAAMTCRMQIAELALEKITEAVEVAATRNGRTQRDLLVALAGLVADLRALGVVE